MKQYIIIISVILSASVHASLITVQNSSFEDIYNDQLNDGTGWEKLSGFSVQAVKGRSSSSNGYLWTGSYHGERILRIQNGTCRQILNAQLSENNEYTLSVLVGNPMPYMSTWSQNYSVQLVAGGNILAESNSANPSKGFTQNLNLSYTTDSSNSYIGKTLEIRLKGTTAVVFDRVSLSYESVPEPSTLLLAGIVAPSLFYVRRKFRL